MLTHADTVLTLETNDVDTLIAQLHQLRRVLRFDGVLTVCDYYIETVTRVAYALGLPCCFPTTAVGERRKNVVRERLDQASITNGRSRARTASRATTSQSKTPSKARIVLRRIRESGKMWMDVEELREEYGLPERTTAALLDATIGLRVRNSSYRALLRDWDERISLQLATNDLRAMVKAGLLRAHGRNRGAYYDAAEPLRAIRARARSSRQPIDTSSLFDPDRP